MKIALALLLLLGISGATQVAATHYVAVNGLDSNPCTQVSPCKTFARAYQVAQPGDAVFVGAGNYLEQKIFVDLTKTSTDDVVFQPMPGEVPVIAGFRSGDPSGSGGNGAKHFTLRNLVLSGEVYVDGGSDDVTLENLDAPVFTIRAAKNVSVLGGDWGPKNDKVATVAGFATQNILIDGASFHDFLITDPAKHAECMQIWPTGATNITIRNSIFRNCTDFGVLVKAPSTSAVVFENVRMDKPMPGSVATTTCNPNCPRGGNSIRFSSYEYPGSRVANSCLEGGLGIDIAGFVQVVNTQVNVTLCFSEPPPPADSLPLTISSQDTTTVTVSWTPVTGIGYRFSVDGKIVSHTWDENRASIKFAKKPGAVFGVEALLPGPKGRAISP